MKTVSISEFLSVDLSLPRIVVDVRSPAEFEEAHIPGAMNMPLFDNAQRAEVGTLYKVSGPEVARVRGLEIVRPRLASFVAALERILGRSLNTTEAILDSAFARVSREVVFEDVGVGESDEGTKAAVGANRLDKSLGVTNSNGDSVDVFFYCWRGGARSLSMALLFEQLGLATAQIIGGHKAFRRAAQDFLMSPQYPFRLVTLYGLTGAAKTKTLLEWQAQGKPVVDLEGLAHHRGSAFGQLGIQEIGRQKDFENNLFWQMWGWSQKGATHLVVEGESRRIGRVTLPDAFLQAMQVGLKVKLEKSVAERVEHLLQEYVGPAISTSEGEAKLQAESLVALHAISRRLGGERTKELSEILTARNYPQFTERLLVEYYDRAYENSRLTDADYDAIIQSAADWDKVESLFRK